MIDVPVRTARERQNLGTSVTYRLSASPVSAGVKIDVKARGVQPGVVLVRDTPEFLGLGAGIALERGWLPGTRPPEAPLSMAQLVECGVVRLVVEKLKNACYMGLLYRGELQFGQLVRRKHHSPRLGQIVPQR